MAAPAIDQPIPSSARDVPAAAVPAIQLKRVSKHFGDGHLRVTAVRDVSLAIDAGDFALLVGPSGSGKSTLLNIIAGLDAASEGDILIGGVSLGAMNDRALSRWRARHVGLLFQSHNLIPVLTSCHNVELPLTLTPCPRKVRRARAAAALARVGLTDRGHHYPHQLSAGEQQRVAIARSIVHEPDLIILDEPTGNLDRRNADEIFSLLNALNRELRKTILMVTHDVAAIDYATRVMELNKGVLH